MRDLLVVTADPENPQRGRLTYAGRSYPCVLGRAGISTSKREGDGATPVGRFPLRRVLYRADKLPAPQTQLPVGIIGRTDGWCDAPDDALYNRPVTLPYPASAENMWRDDALYDVVVVIGHNDDPVVPAAGSAIFMHVAGHEPTAGCIAFSREYLLDILARLLPGADIDIRA